uniref:Uncharacterized protein n=1 Tax=Arundo donax TaxID=35708 RepID=A0A0A9G5N4_ARUDO
MRSGNVQSDKLLNRTLTMTWVTFPEKTNLQTL